ncbi:golgin subfamily A member 3-like [Haliotis cracherodii]|uniref:golgin subfamily A member 3-like n=1 Tax=Haliotis cracherodii TaxID=6455 RepID=UPI0039EC5FE0
MEPFKLTLQQITFDQDQFEYAPQLDSFDAVINYDSCFSANSPPAAAVETSTTSSTTTASPLLHPGTQASYYQTHTPQPVAYQIDPVWSDCSGSPPHQRYLVNPDDSYIKLTDPQNGHCVPRTAAADIAFLSQVTANTAAVRQHISKKKRKFVGRTTVINSTSTAVTTMPSETTSSPPNKPAAPEGEENSSFETVAEALRLQWSVIGNKDITPASPDVVAQIVAEAEKKLKAADGSGTTTPVLDSSRGTTPILPGVTTPTTPTPRGTTPTTPTPRGTTPTTPTPRGTTPVVPEATNTNLPNPGATHNHSQVPSPTLSPQSPTAEVIKHDTPDTAHTGRETPQSADTAEPKELILIPAGSLTRTTTKEKSGWFGGKDSKGAKAGPKGDKKKSDKQRKVSEDSVQDGPVNGSGSVSDRTDDTRSVSSISSEQELEKYNQSETDSFLKSLPPVKSVDMSQFVQHRHSPPVKETSFKPVHNATSPAQQAKVTSSDSGVDMDVSPLLQHPLTSTPYAIPVNKPQIFVPQIGPLFPKTEQVVYNTSSLLQRPVKTSKYGDASPAMKKQLDEVLREKAKLEGQLEVLTHEAQSTLQERAELQAQLASLRLKILSHKGGEHDPEKESLKHEVDMLKKSRETLEQSAREIQKLLEEKIEESKISHEELQMTQEAHDKLQLRMKDLRDDIMSKEVAVQALKNKVAELYVEVQNGLQVKVEFENETKSAKSDLVSLLKTKEWYQQQLQLAHDVRSQLQKELTILQAQSVSQGTIVERLKTDNARLRVQLTDAQHRALKQKEMLAKHLETIESDMMEREAAFQEIQRERAMIEDTFNTQITSAEDERSRLTLLMQINNDLQARLDKAQEDLKKKHGQIFAMENEQMELMKKMTISQETLMEKEKELEDVNQKLIEVEAQLKAFQAEITRKDKEILQLREEKASAEILYQAVKEEKMVVDEALEKLQKDMFKVEKSFKMMKSELSMKLAELEKVNSDKSQLQRELETMRKDLNIKNRSYESMHKDYNGKSTQVQQLEIHKNSLESDVKMLREQLAAILSTQDTSVTERNALIMELSETKQRLEAANQQGTVKVDSVSVQQSSASVVSDERYEEMSKENQAVNDRLAESEQRRELEREKHKENSEQLNNDLTSLKEELTRRQEAFEENVETLSSRLREVMAEKEKVQTELEMMQRKFEISSIEQQDQMRTELQSLASELATSRLSQQELHSQLIALQHAKETEVATLRQELSALEAALQQEREEESEREKTEELNQQLSLELEKERGRLAGLVQNNSSLKQHVSQLEEALARRESSLVEVHAQLSDAMAGQDTVQQDYLRRIQGLEDLLQKEKDGQRDLRKQIGTKISENKRLKKQSEASKQDQEQLRQDVQTRDATLNQLQADLDSSRQTALSHQAQVTSLASTNKGLEQELERVRRDLADNIARNPLIMEQIQSLQWQLQQKAVEVDQLQEQLRLAELRQHTELDSMRKTLQEKQEEIDTLKAEMAAIRKDKLSQKTRVTELRSALKSSVQHHKLAKKIISKKKELQMGAGDGLVTSSGEDKGTQVNFDTPLPLPAPSFDLEAVERLLQDTAVKALESKPLDNLQTCLSSLRSEISGLQRQMDVHTTTVHTSNKSWRSIESEVNELREVVKTVANTTLAATTATTSNAADVVQTQSDVVDI